MIRTNWHDDCWIGDGPTPAFVFGLHLAGILEADMSVGGSLFGIHATALQLRSQRMAMLASNIANAATPNYKARDMDFATALQNASAGESIDSAIGYRVPIQPSLDGNTVELSTEQTAFAENALAYRSSLAFLQGRVGTMMRALKGE
jgi:flagellar basal-body rod protein FlgB